MPEVSPPQVLNPADRTVARHATNNSTRTGISLPFRDLIHGPSKGSIPARWPMAPLHSFMAAETSTEVPSGSPHARLRRDSEAAPDPEARPASDAVLDPLFCQLAVNRGPSSFVQIDPPARVAEVALPLREDLQNLLTGLARRVAWGGDRRKGSARIELSEGALAGATLVVHTEQRSVYVELELPSGVAALRWQERIAERLEARGFAAQVKVA